LTRFETESTLRKVLESTRKPRRRTGFVGAPAPALVLALGLGLAALIAPATAAAQKPSDDPLPSCLDQSIRDELGEELRPRGVQKREFLKNKHVHFVAHGGLFAADLLSSSYIYGGSLGFFFTEDLAVQASLDVTPLALDLDTPLAEFFGDERFEPATGFLGMAGLMWSPIHAKLKIGGGIVHSDIMFMAGAGKLLHDSVQGVTWSAGMALEMFTTQWLTLRLEVRDVIAVQEAVAETRLTNNIMATFGIGLWIPTGL
jgi:outer membrane beta-barrel protein